MRDAEILILVAAFLASAAITGLVRAYALRTGLLDMPNQRSSHVIATPRGGGLSIVIVFLAVVVLLLMRAEIDSGLALTILIGGGLIAVIGFIDDHSDVSAKWRFLVQVAAALLAVGLLGGLPDIQLGMNSVDLGVAGDLLLVACIVWFTNAFNFMDGIDGIAASESICIACGAVLLSSGQGGSVPLLFGVLMLVSLGFLLWNWPPAKIFMGDVGSAFLGFILAVMLVYASHLELISVWSGLILVSVFLIDTTITLGVRVFRRDNWTSAHRSHAYQIASRRLGHHAPVTIGVVAINAFWLIPLAYMASNWTQYGWLLTLIAWLPLVALEVWLGAGQLND